ncbi:pyruvate dehydrogenase complex dihydrolipoamide acetyltransferase [Kribbella sancticallisti]|uniref:Dihydrolipoamide acetyltransferase component of pyruvate dehydrogenase complex n=1 Tax=Kribbella sancticallisti TaxID=460087 RepID=A0ABN2C6E1_9ACTN
MAEILRMPEVAANTAEGILESWIVEVKTPYSAGDPIVTVETEKAVVDVEAEADGILLRLLVDAGATVAVGTPIAIWGVPDEPESAVDALVASLTGDPEQAVAAGPAVPEVVAPSKGERIFASPLARRLARESRVDLAAVPGSGPNGRIRRADIEAALAAVPADRDAVPADRGAVPADRGAVPADRDAVPADWDVVAADRDAALTTSAGAEVEAPGVVEVPNSRMRMAIARRLTESKQSIPHFYLRAAARVDALMDLRRQINAGGGVKVSVNDLLVKAIARAHAEVPAMNVQWNDTSIRHVREVDIAVAVATDGGLVTPVVRGVDSLPVSSVAAATKDLIARAKDRRLRQDELEGGTISITNLGMYGTEDFAAIINPPQAAILAVGAIRPQAVVEDDAVIVASVLRLTLAVDHRPVDGATAAQWMKAYVDLLEHPLRILL